METTRINLWPIGDIAREVYVGTVGGWTGFVLEADKATRRALVETLAVAAEV